MRVIVTRGVGTIGPDPRKIEPQLIVIAEEYKPFPPELYEHGVNIISYPLRLLEGSTPWIARSLCQAHIVEAKIAELASGCLDSILIHENGNVASCTEGDLFAVNSESVRCAEQKDPISVAILDVVEQLGLRHDFCAVTSDDLHSAEELFLAGTSCGVIGIAQLDGKPIGNGKEGPITKRIREAYRKLTRGEE